ncbi:MAG: Outer membrane protein assembly factor BamB [Anaerolineales bacterium]|nr:Outer membrane protein assembly factor BamB [Anaerolineales bacterium]
MKPKITVVVLVVSAVLLSCGFFQPSQVIENEKFPLDELWSVNFNIPVYKLAASNEVIAIGTSNGVQAIEASTGKSLWILDFPLDTDSILAFTGNNLVVADSAAKQIIIIGPEGNEIRRFNLDSEGDFQVLAVHSKFVFVRTVPSWNLEVFDLQTGMKNWQILVDRGDVSISFDSASEVTYITTSSFVGAYDATSGNEIWKFSSETRTGVLDSGVLYYYSEDTKNNKNVGYISAIDIQDGSQLWSVEIPLEIRTAIYNLATFNDLLIASTDFGLIALSKIDGHEIWQSETNEFVYGKPITINDFLYARGTNTRILYAISPDNGSYVGYLKLGTPPLLATSQRENDILYRSGDRLIFTFGKLVYAYQMK